MLAWLQVLALTTAPLTVSAPDGGECPSAVDLCREDCERLAGLWVQFERPVGHGWALVVGRGERALRRVDSAETDCTELRGAARLVLELFGARSTEPTLQAPPTPQAPPAIELTRARLDPGPIPSWAPVYTLAVEAGVGSALLPGIAAGARASVGRQWLPDVHLEAGASFWARRQRFDDSLLTTSLTARVDGGLCWLRSHPSGVQWGGCGLLHIGWAHQAAEHQLSPEVEEHIILEDALVLDGSLEARLGGQLGSWQLHGAVGALVAGLGRQVGPTHLRAEATRRQPWGGYARLGLSGTIF